MTNQVDYTANGSSSVFPFPFPIDSHMSCQVLIAGAVQTGGYSIRGQGSIDGGAVVFDNAPAPDLAITIRRLGEAFVTPLDAGGGYLADKLVAGNGIGVATVTASGGVQHLVISSIDALAGLSKSENLADLVDKPAARTNLDVYSKAEVEALDQAVTDAALLKVDNLSGLADIAIARTNLGVYSKAEVEARDQAVTDAALLKVDNLSGLADTAIARTNLGVYSKAEVEALDQAVTDAALLKADNLLSLTDTATARTNLDVYSKSEVEARDQAVTDAALLKADNLLSLTNTATARTNLGVYSKAEVETRDQAMTDAALLKADNLLSLTNTATARTNLGVYSKAEVEARDQAVTDAALLKADNLLSLTNTTTARTNLGVYGKTEVDGIAAGVRTDALLKAQNLADLPNKSAARTALELDLVAYLNVAQDWSKPQRSQAVQTASVGGSTVLDLAQYQNFNLTLSANVTFANPTITLAMVGQKGSIGMIPAGFAIAGMGSQWKRVGTTGSPDVITGIGRIDYHIRALDRVEYAYNDVEA